MRAKGVAPTRKPRDAVGLACDSWRGGGGGQNEVLFLPLSPSCRGEQGSGPYNIGETLGLPYLKELVEESR